MNIAGQPDSEALGKLLAANALQTLELNSSPAAGAIVWQGIAVSTSLVELDIRSEFGPVEADAVAQLLKNKNCSLCSLTLALCTAAEGALGCVLRILEQAMFSNQSLTDVSVMAQDALGRDERGSLRVIEQCAADNAHQKRAPLHWHAGESLWQILADGGYAVPHDCTKEVASELDRIDADALLRLAGMSLPADVNSPGSP